jgi:hypothetical protein
MEADVEEDGMAVGKYLRIKVRISIKKPLMKGIALERGEGKSDIWCRFVYEFLPDFCFRCGMFDHIDRNCKVVLAKGEIPQFGNWMKAYIPKSNTEQNRSAWVLGRSCKQRQSCRWQQHTLWF